MQNNGDLVGEYDQDGANASLGHTSSYTYDHLNRLATGVASPTQTGGAAYNLTFNYDRYGNKKAVASG